MVDKFISYHIHTRLISTDKQCLCFFIDIHVFIKLFNHMLYIFRRHIKVRWQIVWLISSVSYVSVYPSLVRDHHLPIYVTCVLPRDIISKTVHRYVSLLYSDT